MNYKSFFDFAVSYDHYLLSSGGHAVFLVTQAMLEQYRATVLPPGEVPVVGNAYAVVDGVVYDYGTDVEAALADYHPLDGEGQPLVEGF